MRGQLLLCLVISLMHWQPQPSALRTLSKALLWGTSGKVTARLPLRASGLLLALREVVGQKLESCLDSQGRLEVGVLAALVFMQDCDQGYVKKWVLVFLGGFLST